MKLKDYKNCPLCGSKKTFPFIKRDISKIELSCDSFKITDSNYGKGWNYSRCRECLFVFANPMPDRELLYKLYSDMEDPDYTKEAEGREDNFKRIIDRIKKFKSNGKLLDVGASAGLFMRIARENGFDVYGIEPSKWAVEYGKSFFKLDNLIEGDFLEKEINEKFDVITMLDLVEHLSNPLKALEKANKLLNEDGLLVVVTPDIDSFFSRLMGRRWWHIRIAHLNFFNKKSIEYVMRKAGFKIKEIHPFFWKFSLHYLLTRFSVGKKICDKIGCNFLKRFHIKLYLFDSMEVYAEKRDN